MKRLLCLALFVAACRGAQPAVDWPDVELTGDRVTVMTFNVENLFDARHDAGKGDYEYLPLASKRNAAHRARCAKVKRQSWRTQCLEMDWSEDMVDAKMRALAPAILQVDGGKGPDVLILQEIENFAVLETLRTKHLAAAGYRAPILIEGDDYRGIDTAILTRLKLSAKPDLHKIPFAGMSPAQQRDSRGILQARLALPDGKDLYVLAVHMPAPFHPAEFRAQGLAFLKKLQGTLPPQALVVAAGDFNVPSAEDAAFDVWAGQEDAWLVSHRIGCEKCRGSTYYRPKDQWSFLDVILLSRAFHPRGGGGWTVLRDSIALANQAPGQITRFGTPARFDGFHGEGVSDHWPVVVTLAGVQMHR